MNDKVLLEVKTPRTGEETPEVMVQFLASLASIKPPKSLFKKIEIPISLEIAAYDATIHFYITVPAYYQAFIESQLLSQYPKALITQVTDDYLNHLLQVPVGLDAGFLKLEHNLLYPLKTFRDFKDVDPLSSVLGMLSRLERDEVALVQILLLPSSNKWQGKGQKKIEQKGENKEEDPLLLSTYAKQVSDKVAYPGFRTGIRFLVKGKNSQLINLLAATFTSFNSVTGNSLIFQRPFFWEKQAFLKAVLSRNPSFVSNKIILNIVELATLYHFPTQNLATMQNVSWSKTILSDPPENLPVVQNLPEEEKEAINFFARTEFKNKTTSFGIIREDRRKHIYIIGKTGVGKSTLIANLAIGDMRNREGLAVIDPHGDLSEVILDFVPSFRINDVVYFNPADLEHPIRLNPLEVTNPGQKELVASGIVAIFYKLYGYSWGPRLEHILRNVILTLIDVPNSTFLMVPDILTNPKFRKKVVEEYLKDPVIKNFWLNEFDKMPDRLRGESIDPILNKVGQFLSSQVIRNIIGHPKSTISLEDIMDSGKILILNLSQGRIGEDNSALLGAMIITKLQLAAMNRVNISESERKDFYLYVDEFQNFATTSFIKILSEARKYRLNLILANQYTAQIDPLVRSAIFGNAGTIMSFLIGAEDAPILAKEFGERFKEEDLLSLGNYQLLIKMSIKNMTSAPFLAQTLPLPQSKTQNREKVILSSRQRYARTLQKGEIGKDDIIKPPILNSKEFFVKFLKD